MTRLSAGRCAGRKRVLMRLGAAWRRQVEFTKTLPNLTIFEKGGSYLPIEDIFEILLARDIADGGGEPDRTSFAGDFRAKFVGERDQTGGRHSIEIAFGQFL